MERQNAISTKYSGNSMKLKIKRVMVLLVSLFAINGVVIADNDKAIQAAQLPIKAQEFIKQYFPTNDIALAKMESEFLDKNYEVVFVSGDKVEFHHNGEWGKIDCRFSVFPLPIVPQQIKDYVAKFYPNLSICQIEHDRKGYEIQLSNGIELRFNRNYQIIDIDN